MEFFMFAIQGRTYSNTHGHDVKRSTLELDYAANETPTATIVRRTHNRLIISAIAGHNATELCASPLSRGPDLVSLEEGVFCDMTTSKTLPLCSDHILEKCFDHINKVKVGPKGSRLKAKPYTDTLDWTSVVKH